MSNETISNKPAGRVLDLTSSSITGTMLRFALPMIAGNLLQQLYNVADTLIVGRFLGSVALAAVGSSYTLMTFLTSILLGLCMGSGAFFSIRYGEKDFSRLRAGIFASFTLIAALTFVINAAVFLWIDPIMRLLSVPVSVYGLMREYLWVIFFGIAATFLYNFFACLLRAAGNSVAPLWFLGVAALLNIGLDLLFVAVLGWGIGGAAAATILAQYASAIGIGLYVCWCCRSLLPGKEQLHFDRPLTAGILRLGIPIALQDVLVGVSFLVILAIVNSLGLLQSAGMGIAEKVCAFVMLLPSAFSQSVSAFVAQNTGAGKPERAKKALRYSVAVSLCISVFVFYFNFFHGDLLAGIFANDHAVILEAADYLKAYAIDCLLTSFLFCFVGYFSGLGKTVFVMTQGILGAFGVRIPVSFAMSRLPNVRLFYIGLATPCSTVVQVLLCLGYYAHLARRERRA